MRSLRRAAPAGRARRNGSTSTVPVGLAFEIVVVVDLVAGQNAVFAAGLEEGDRDHQGAGEGERVVLGEGEIVRHF